MYAFVVDWVQVDLCISLPRYIQHFEIHIVKEQYKYFSVFTRFLSVLKKFSTWQIDLKFHSLHNWQIVFFQRMCTYTILVDSFYLFFSKLHFKNLLFFDLKRYLALMNICKCVLCNMCINLSYIPTYNNNVI